MTAASPNSSSTRHGSGYLDFLFSFDACHIELILLFCSHV